MCRVTVYLALAVALCACSDPEPTEMPAASDLTREAIGYYCHMIVVDHKGPKGQIFLEGNPDPLWFTSVRDTLAFTMLPEEPKNIAAIYVNDMGAATDWDSPRADTWIDARKAIYVLGSERVGGMGAPEAVPFTSRAAALKFAERYGGHLADFASVPKDYVLTPVATPDAGHPAD